MHTILNTVKNVHAFVIATPIYFSSIPAPLKAVVDRFQPWWVRKYQWGSRVRAMDGKAAFLAVGGQDREPDFACAERIARAVFATSDFTFVGSVYAPHVEKPGELRSYVDLLADAAELGRRIAEV